MTCVLAGLVIGLTCGARRPLLACLGWTLACAAANLVLAQAGCAVTGALD